MQIRNVMSVAIIAVSMVAYTEVLALRTSVYVSVCDESGRIVGRRQLRAGTKIAVIESIKDDEDDAKETKPGKKKVLRYTTMSPTEFVATQTNKKHTFRGVVEMSSSSHREFQKGEYRIQITIANKTRSVQETIYTSAFRGTKVGKALYNLVKDGKPHFVTITLHYGMPPHADRWRYYSNGYYSDGREGRVVFVDAFELLEDDVEEEVEE